MHRRKFTCGLAAFSLATSSLDRVSHAIDPFERPQPASLKLSLAAYSMRQYLAPKPSEPNKMDLFGFVDFCQSQGIPGAELTSYYFPDPIPSDYLVQLKRHCHLRGISISGGAIRNDFCQTDSAKLELDLQHTRNWIDHYATLGAPAIRIFAGNQIKGEKLTKTLDRCAQHVSVACEYAAQKGVMLALENHGGVTAKATDLVSLVERVDSPALGINFDSGNFRSSNDPYAELAMIAPYAINAQIKTEIAPNGKKQEADLARIIHILREAGYSGWVTLEFEAKGEPIQEIPKYLSQLKELLA